MPRLPPLALQLYLKYLNGLERQCKRWKCLAYQGLLFGICSSRTAQHIFGSGLLRLLLVLIFLALGIKFRLQLNG